jgi:hypothetical protein
MEIIQNVVCCYFFLEEPSSELQSTVCVIQSLPLVPDHKYFHIQAVLSDPRRKE